MTNHPNRSRAKSPVSNPTIDQIKSARAAAGLTQKQAAELIMCTVRAWEQWECGNRRMHPALYDYFLIKIGQKSVDTTTL
jgi:putative transcriptional regulator